MPSLETAMSINVTMRRTYYARKRGFNPHDTLNPDH
jgi:hypothetical protein